DFVGNLVEKDPANGVVAAVVRILQVWRVPVVRITGAIVLGPELAAMDSVPEEGGVHRHDADRRVSAGRTAKGGVIGGVYGHYLRPRRQSCGFRGAAAVGRVVDVGDENAATAGEACLQQREDFAETGFVLGDPRLGLLQSRAVHRPFPRWRTPVPMDQVV